MTVTASDWFKLLFFGLRRPAHCRRIVRLVGVALERLLPPRFIFTTT